MNINDNHKKNVQEKDVFQKNQKEYKTNKNYKNN